jgi:IS6 family transposase
MSEVSRWMPVSACSTASLADRGGSGSRLLADTDLLVGGLALSRYFTSRRAYGPSGAVALGLASTRPLRFVPRPRLEEAAKMKQRHRLRVSRQPASAFAGSRFPSEVIVLAVRWYLRYGLSYRDLEELLAERGTAVDHVTLYRWVQRFTPIMTAAAGPWRHAVDSRWFVDETYVKVTGRWRYVYRAVDEHGQVIEVFVSKRRDVTAAELFFATAIRSHGAPTEVTTDRSAALARAITELLPASLHQTTRYANNRVEADHGRLKARLRPMRGLKRDRTASAVIRGHAFVQNLRRRHYELGTDALPGMTLAAAFDELALAILRPRVWWIARSGPGCYCSGSSRLTPISIASFSSSGNWSSSVSSSKSTSLSCGASDGS